MQSATKNSPAPRYCRGLMTVACLLAGSWAASPAFGQRITALPPPQLAQPAQRLMMEQAEELSVAGEFAEALKLLERLLDDAEDRLVPVDYQAEAGTLKTQRYIPLADWANFNKLELFRQFPDQAATEKARQREQATLALEQLQRSKDPVAARRLTRRYQTTESGSRFQLFLCDLYLEHAWGVAASQAIATGFPSSRIALGPPGKSAPLGLVIGSLHAPYVAQQMQAKPTAGAVPARWSEAVGPAVDPAVDPVDGPREPLQLSDIATRLAVAAAMNPEALDLQATLTWGELISTELSEVDASQLRSYLQQVAKWPRMGQRETPPAAEAVIKHQLPRGPTAQQPSWADWPAWSQTMEKYAFNGDQLLASRPPVAESERATLPYFPVVHAGRVFVNEMTRLVAYDLRSGQPWPDPRGTLPLFDSHISAATYLPLGYPMSGTPRGTLVIDHNCLYARLGSPITGRVNIRPTGADGDSFSYLVGLDLERQGMLLPGFPLHLSSPEFTHAEFDGPPIVWGERLMVAVAERDHVGLRRSVAAFDRVTGQLLWRSGTLATGTVAGADRANLIAHQQLTLAGGRLFYNTQLGSIVCLDPLTGATQWLVQYSTPPENQEFPRPNRYRYRDLTPCWLSAGLVYCAPQDTPEIFALDALTGDLVWSTDDYEVADAIQLLGTHEDSLVVSGDRLIWLDKYTGQVQGRFPAATTPLTQGALPSPRGLGRGSLFGGRVYWPTAGEMFVFPASRSPSDRWDEPPTITRRLPIEPGGGDGVNVLFAEGVLLVASPSRLMAFPAYPPNLPSSPP